MVQDNTLEIQMVAAANTTNYCKQNNIVEWIYNNEHDMEVYSEEAQLYFATQIVNLGGGKERSSSVCN